MSTQNFKTLNDPGWKSSLRLEGICIYCVIKKDVKNIKVSRCNILELCWEMRARVDEAKHKWGKNFCLHLLPKGLFVFICSPLFAKHTLLIDWVTKSEKQKFDLNFKLHMLTWFWLWADLVTLFYLPLYLWRIEKLKTIKCFLFLFDDLSCLHVLYLPKGNLAELYYPLGLLYTLTKSVKVCSPRASL